MKLIKILFFILLFMTLPLQGNLSTQEKIKQIIYFGQLELLDFKIDEVDLSNFNEQELIILMNFPVAKHNKIFKTKWIQEYFNKFNWYKPKHEDVTDKLSELDKCNIKIVFDFIESTNFYQQNPSLYIDNYNLEFDWNSYNIKLSNSEKVNEIKKIINPYDINFFKSRFNEDENSINNFLTSFNFIDINNDGKNDIIQNSFYGSSELFSIYINNGKNYTFLFHENGFLKKLIKNKNKNHIYLNICQKPCCSGDPFIYEHIFLLKNNLALKKEVRVFYELTEKPKTEINQFKKFYIIKENTILRAIPSEKTTDENHPFLKDNILTYLPKNTLAFELTRIFDNNETVWIYGLFKTNNVYFQNQEYKLYRKNFDNVFLYGWIKL